MLPRILNRLTLVAITATVPGLVMATRAAPEQARVGGTFTMTYTQRHPLPIADAEGHALIATEAKGRCGAPERTRATSRSSKAAIST